MITLFWKVLYMNRKENYYLCFFLTLLLSLPGCAVKTASTSPASPWPPESENKTEFIHIYIPPKKHPNAASETNTEPVKPLLPPRETAMPEEETAENPKNLLPSSEEQSPEEAPESESPLPSETPDSPELDVVLKPTSGNIVLVTYHALCTEALTKDPWQFFRTAADFEKDLKLIKECGIQVKSYNEILTALKNGDPSVREPALILQFDDGLKSDYDLALPLLQKYGMKSTHFISSVRAAEHHKGFMSFEEIQAMRNCRTDQGVPLIEVGVHGGKHIAIGRQVGESEEAFHKKLQEELSLSKTILENALGESVNLLALPFGSGFKEEAVESYGKSLGYDLIRGWRKDLGHFPSYALDNLKFYPVYNNSDLREAIRLAYGEK